MKEFTYTITDPVGIHARPAGKLTKKSADFNSTITVFKGEKSANVRRLMTLMSLGIKCGDTITVRAEGVDEASAAAEIQAFLEENNY